MSCLPHASRSDIGRCRAVAATLAFAIAGTACAQAPAQVDVEAAAFTVVAAGDIADCGSDGSQFPNAARTARLILPTDVAVLTLGDHTYPVGASSEFANCFEPTWGQLRERLRPSPGNHDYMTTDAAGYFGYFGAGAGPARRGYYSYDIGDWHFISLNSNVDAGPGSAQHSWLEADLAAAANKLCAIAYWHHPVFTSGPHGDDPHMAAIWALLHGAGVELVLAAHDHIYERFAPQDASGNVDAERGVRAFTAGTGGARLYSIRAVKPNSEYRDGSRHGVLRLTLQPTGYRWVFVAVDGSVRDQGDDRCHR